MEKWLFFCIGDRFLTFENIKKATYAGGKRGKRGKKCRKIADSSSPNYSVKR
jgi:hypothetical protein